MMIKPPQHPNMEHVLRLATARVQRQRDTAQAILELLGGPCAFNETYLGKKGKREWAEACDNDGKKNCRKPHLRRAKISTVGACEGCPSKAQAILDDDRTILHLTGAGTPVGAHLLDADGRAQLLALDGDAHGVEKPGPEASPLPVLSQVSDTAAIYGLTTWLEHSSDGNGHLLLPLAVRVEGAWARQLWRGLLSAAGVVTKPAGSDTLKIVGSPTNIELRPGSAANTAIAQPWWGDNLGDDYQVRQIVDPDTFQVLPGQPWPLLQRMLDERPTQEDLEAAEAKLRDKGHWPTTPEPERKRTSAAPKAPMKGREEMADINPGVAPDGAERVLESCDALAGLAAGPGTGRHGLSYHERMVLGGVLAHLPDGAEAIHQTIRATCDNYSVSKTDAGLAWLREGKPWTCAAVQRNGLCSYEGPTCPALKKRGKGTSPVAFGYPRRRPQSMTENEGDNAPLLERIKRDRERREQQR